MDAHIPKAVLEIKIAQNPTSRAFLRPILEIVIAWIGVQTTPARLKQQSVHAIITVEILSPYTELTYKGKKLEQPNVGLLNPPYAQSKSDAELQIKSLVVRK